MIDFQEVNKIKLKKDIIAFLMSTIIGIGIILVVMGLVLGVFIYGIIGIIMLPIGIFLFLKVIKSAYRFDDVFKDEYARPYLESLIKDFKYDLKDGFKLKDLLKCNIVKEYEYFHSSNLMSGIYKDVKFSRSDVSVTGVENIDKRIEVNQYFKGKIFTTTFDKPFTYDLFVTKDSLINGLENYHKASIKGLQLTKNYNVYTTDKEALYSNIPESLTTQIRQLMQTKNLYSVIIKNQTIALLINDNLNSFQKRTGDIYTDILFIKYFKDLNSFVNLVKSFDSK